MDKRNLIIIVITIVTAYILTLLPIYPESFSQEAIYMLAIAFIGAAFWVTECISIYLTGLVIMVLQGIVGILPIGESLSYIATPVNSLIFAGFVIAKAFSKYNLDKRMSLQVISFMGESTHKLVLGIMIATAFSSMWISNTAATAIMIPIALGIIHLEDIEKGKSNLAKAMMLGIAYSANIGGMGTPAGTPASSITVAFLDDIAGIEVSFLEWMTKAVPVVIVLVPLVWLLLTYVIYPLKMKKIEGGSTMVKKELEKMGELTKKQKHVLVLFSFAVALWVANSFLPLMEGWLYIASVLIILLFMAPVIGVVKWEETKDEIGWGVFILVGGGLALGSGLESTGVVAFISNSLGEFLVDYNIYIILTILAFITAFSITLFSSLTATSSTFVPIAIALAVQFNMDVTMFAMVAGLAACLAFLLPANTPPNAIAYSYGYFKTYEMIKSGLPTTLLSAIVLSIIISIMGLLL